MKTILLALAMVFAVGCTEIETRDHFITCTEHYICPGHSTCQYGVCVEEAGTCSADSECPGEGTCREGLCYAADGCYLKVQNGSGTLLPTPGPSVNLLTYGIHRQGPTTPECAPEFLNALVIINVTPPVNFIPQVEMRINGEKQTEFWLSDATRPFGDSNWNTSGYAWEGDLVIQAPQGEPVFNIVEINCTNCDASMPAGISIYTSVYSYSWRKNPADELSYNGGSFDALGVNQLVLFPK